ncbi:alpha-hydroxy acid oxidase [Komagataeibacter europaeus]|uniref:alpha-hydroxy acid oxidase n=1 Tax=Komagataeibacter europaeus TaxID=33995 RepID=UPI0003027D8C|nr:alpha-hydroxy-acid oxidizing protein [Komagataeibacter europaeus]
MEFSGIDDLCQMANRRLPRLFRDYVNGGAHGEVALRANRQAFLDWKIIPRCLRDVSQVDIGSTWLGRSRGAPFMLGPVGFAGMMHAGGDVMAAQAAARAGILRWPFPPSPSLPWKNCPVCRAWTCWRRSMSSGIAT